VNNELCPPRSPLPIDKRMTRQLSEAEGLRDMRVFGVTGVSNVAAVLPLFSQERPYGAACHTI